MSDVAMGAHKDATVRTSSANGGAQAAHGPSLWGSELAYKVVRGGLAMLFMVGMGIMLYPFADRLKFAFQSVSLSEEYQRALEDAGDEDVQLAWALAQEYNRACAYNLAHDVNVIMDPFTGGARTAQLNEEYWSLVNPMGTGVMGFLDVPKINERLAIYHGTDEDALMWGVGHIQGTSLPVGGSGSHCVLCGHRGLPGATIFTYLDQLAEGDYMLLHVLNHDLAYAVDSVRVVEPEEIAAIQIMPGEDLLTLVTCTPYALNTHRLLVRGHRVPYVEESMPIVGLHRWVAPLCVAICLVLVLVLVRRRSQAGRSGSASL